MESKRIIKMAAVIALAAIAIVLFIRFVDFMRNTEITDEHSSTETSVVEVYEV